MGLSKKGGHEKKRDVISRIWDWTPTTYREYIQCWYTNVFVPACLWHTFPSCRLCFFYNPPPLPGVGLLSHNFLLSPRGKNRIVMGNGAPTQRIYILYMYICSGKIIGCWSVVFFFFKGEKYLIEFIYYILYLQLLNNNRRLINLEVVLI